MKRRTLLTLSALGLGLAGSVKYEGKPSAANLQPGAKPEFDLSTNKNFNPFFQDGSSLQIDSGPISREPQNITVSVHEIGDLIVTSGKLIASDPLIEPDPRYYFTKTIPPGRYPVVLSVAVYQSIPTARIGCAMLRISNALAVRWELAAMNEQQPRKEQGETYGYGVDSGTGCFMDWDAAQALYVLANPDPTAYESARRTSFDEAWKLSTAALDRFDQEFCDRVNAEREKNFIQYSTADWANVSVNNATAANVIAFSTGWGDGAYRSYWGYDAKGNLVNLVTDFLLFDSDKD